MGVDEDTLARWRRERIAENVMRVGLLLVAIAIVWGLIVVSEHDEAKVQPVEKPRPVTQFDIDNVPPGADRDWDGWTP